MYIIYWRWTKSNKFMNNNHHYLDRWRWRSLTYLFGYHNAYFSLIHSCKEQFYWCFTVSRSKVFHQWSSSTSRSSLTIYFLFHDQLKHTVFFWVSNYILYCHTVFYFTSFFFYYRFGIFSHSSDNLFVTFCT